MECVLFRPADGEKGWVTPSPHLYLGGHRAVAEETLWEDG